MGKRSMMFFVILALLILSIFVFCNCILPILNNHIDWSMYGTLLGPDGTTISTTNLEISGNLYGNDGTHELNLNIVFPDSFEYWYDGKHESPVTYLSVKPKHYGLSYFWVDAFSYHHSTHNSVKSSFALCNEKEYAIFYWDDGTGRFLVASTDPSVEADTILKYFQVFYHFYQAAE